MLGSLTLRCMGMQACMYLQAHAYACMRMHAVTDPPSPTLTHTHTHTHCLQLAPPHHHHCDTSATPELKGKPITTSGQIQLIAFCVFEAWCVHSCKLGGV